MSSRGEATSRDPGRYDGPVLNAALAAFVLALVYVGFRHEPWFDEAQAWLIARDDTPWRILSQTARYEGTPPLWHLLLWAPAHLGFPYRGLWLISSGLACCGAYIVLYRSVFPVLMRVGIVFSYYFAYQYAIIARSYAIDLLLFPVLALCYRESLRKPFLYCLILGLIANCNTHGFLLSGVLFLDFLWKSWKQRVFRKPYVVAAILLYGSMALTALAVAWPPSDVSFKTNGWGGLSAVHGVLLIAEPFIERFDVFSLDEPSLASQLGGVVISILLIWPTAYLFHKSDKLWLFLALFGVFYAFTASKHGSAWHAGLLFLVWIFCLWTSWEDVDRLSSQRRVWLRVSISVVLLIQCWYTIAAWKRDINQIYAPGREVTSAINRYLKTHPKAKIAGMGFKAFTIQPWIDHNVFDNFKNKTPGAAYFDWRQRQPYVALLDFADWRRLIERQYYDMIILSSLDTIKTHSNLTAYIQEAKSQHYCERYFPASMIWKTYLREDQSIIMFTPCRPARTTAEVTQMGDVREGLAGVRRPLDLP